MDDAHLAGLGRVLQHLLLASYGMYPEDLERELNAAVRHLGGDDVVLLLADYDQQLLVGFNRTDERRFLIDGPGPGLSYRQERVIEEALDDGRRRLWIPAKDSAERHGVLGVVDDGSVPDRHWETVASLIGELIVSKSLYGDHITLRKRGAPFSLAAEMRWGLLPPLTFTSPDVTIAGVVHPSHGIAGDAFDYGVTSRTASLTILDAMGHGLEASRMANVAVGCARNARRAGADPVATLLAVDEAIATQFGDSRFVTAQVATYDLDTGRLEVANAGHPPPLRLRPGHPVETLDCRPARPAGLGTEPSSTTVQLDPGDGVLFRTDGIVEARSPDGDFFGDERLAGIVAEMTDRGAPPSEILRRSMQVLVEHQDGRSSDDATLLLLRRSDDARLTGRD